tara:strand:+ start:23934 stop:24944 length:1011 start_codon:yes stop_codon:yes gene_type:complete
MQDFNIQKQPLVTFALITYNQVDYVEDSIRGALSQDYLNLEIIISDDCSTDGTFEKAREIVSSYEGDHIVRLNQTSKNKCTLGHFFDVVGLAEGELLVLAAGDDISKPERVTKTVNIWKAESAVGIFSNHELIDENGVANGRVYNPSGESQLLTKVFKKENSFDIHGASSSYDMSFLRSLPRIEGRFFFEDTFMTFMINILDKKISKIDEPLVFYRSHSESISNSKLEEHSLSIIQATEKRASDYASNKHDLYILLRELGLNFPSDKVNINFDRQELNNHIDKLKLKSSWTKSLFLKRVSYTYKYRHDKHFYKWIAPRVLGLELFSVFKIIKTKIT